MFPLVFQTSFELLLLEVENLILFRVVLSLRMAKCLLYGKEDIYLPSHLLRWEMNEKFLPNILFCWRNVDERSWEICICICWRMEQGRFFSLRFWSFFFSALSEKRSFADLLAPRSHGVNHSSRLRRVLLTLLSGTEECKQQSHVLIFHYVFSFLF